MRAANKALERAGRGERIKERIAGNYQELQALPEKIREAGERVKQWEYERELFSAPSFAEPGRRARPTGILPLGFGGQAIGCLVKVVVQSLGKGLRIMPGDDHGRVAQTLKGAVQGQTRARCP